MQRDVCGLPAASGFRYVSSGFAFAPGSAQTIDWSIGVFDQSLVVPEAPAKLSFEVRIVDSPGAPDVGMKLIASLDGIALTEFSDEPSTSFQQVTIPIPPAQSAQSATVRRRSGAGPTVGERR